MAFFFYLLFLCFSFIFLPREEVKKALEIIKKREGKEKERTAAIQEEKRKQREEVERALDEEMESEDIG